MKQLAIISREEDSIERKLSDCVELLEHTGVCVYATHRGRGYAVIWADDQLGERTTQLLRAAGLDVAPLTRGHSPQIRTPAPLMIVSNQNSPEQAPRQTDPDQIKRAIHHTSNLLSREHHAEGRNE